MAEPMADARLQAIRARLDAATPRPWQTFRDSVLASAWVNRGDDPICEVVTDANDRSPDQGDADADLIANAPTDLADLLDEVERLREDINALHYERDVACASVQEQRVREVSRLTAVAEAAAAMEAVRDEPGHWDGARTERIVKRTASFQAAVRAWREGE